MSTGEPKALLAMARELAGRLQHHSEEARLVSSRLRASVVRPLTGTLPGAGDADGEPPGTPDGQEASASPGTMADELWQLARAATHALVAEPGRPGLAEAVAALQDLAITASDDAAAASRLAELEDLQAGLRAEIRVAPDGPYLVTNARYLADWLGLQMPSRPQMALCRCGHSDLKPLCDGSHATVGFSGAKDPDRVPDRRDSYAGQQVDILDNRGICQHAGYCTDRLKTVFHTGQEPFIKPSGGRMDEIIRAVRDCPSGALSYAVDGREARDDADFHQTREQSIEVTRDGPYRVTGGIPLADASGADVLRAQGASWEHYALCRCGQSRNKPFCSGAHWYADFHDPAADAGRQPAIFEWAGGLTALTRMTRLFYEKYVPEDPLLAPLFATMSPDHPQRVAKWLAEVFCGPEDYSTGYGGYPRMVSQHKGKSLTEEQRARWVTLLLRSARDAGLPNDAEFRSAFGAYIEWGSRLAVENSQPGARPPGHMPMPRWDWNTAAGPPGSRISALAPPEEAGKPTVLPAASEPVSFEAHVRTLFRRLDRQSMLSSFDLWSYDDVVVHADAILARVRAGTMPCDGAWAPDQVAAFQRWVEEGKPR
jgi:CDGSH-type Zn-finger protein